MVAGLMIPVIPVDSIEQARLRQQLPDDPLAGWRNYRFEYGGHASECIYEGQLLLPPGANPDAICALIMGMQAHGAMWVKLPRQDNNAEVIVDSDG